MGEGDKTHLRKFGTRILGETYGGFQELERPGRLKYQELD